MPLTEGTRLGPYEILAPIGAGGMGEVYKARDTRLDRTVAIKLLHAKFALQADARQRFEREARAISSLNHPHICTLFDVGQHDTTEFLVMEYLEGETLQSRVRRGALPLDEVVRYGVQIASALAEAHQQGILHRDIKPANVMLTKNGVKLLDFGLAKLRSSEPDGVNAGSVLETVSLHETGKGTIVGTLQYMAPEQLEAKEVDARTDIFALGLVLYEMATGRRASNADSQAALIVQIMRAEFAPLPDVPRPFAHVVERCMAADPANRWHAAADVKLELQWAAAWTPPVQAASLRRPRGQWMAAAGLLLVGLGVLWLFTHMRDSARPQRVLRLSVNPPPGGEFSLENSGALVGGKGAAISPDGQLMAFVMTARGVDKLWVRRLDSLSGKELPGTEGARYPFWSPDSQSVCFFAGGKISRIEVSGGLPVTVCDSPSARGGSWSSSGVIVFSPNAGPLQRVAASGGNPVPATTVDAARGENSHRWPYFLPDGRRFLYSIRTANSVGDGVYVASLDRPGERIRLTSGSLNAAYAPARNNRGGYLLWVRDGRLLAQHFNAERMKLSGEPAALAESVEVAASAYYSVSNEGTILYARAGQTKSQPAWYSREGKPLGGAGPDAAYSEPAISPDGNRLALVRRETSGTTDIWLIDLSRGATERLTLHGGIHPAWSPDGQRIAYVLAGHINAIDTNGSGREENLSVSPNSVLTLQNWSPDGKFLLYQYYSYELNWKTRNDLWLLPLSGERKPAALLQSEFQETSGRFSGDGKWISYTSDQSGAYEIYVQRFPSDGTKRQVSIGGGDHPRWRKDGRELFYRSASGKLMAVPINGGEFASPMALFDIGNRAFDVAPDGQRFLVLNPVER